MQNKTASLLLIIGSVSIFLLTTISIFFNEGTNEYKSPSLDMIRIFYYLSQITATAASIIFGVFYYRSGLKNIRIPGIIFLVSALFSIVYFAVSHYTYPPDYFSNVRLTILILLWIAGFALKVIIGVQFLKKRTNFMILGWVIFLIGAVAIIESAPNIYLNIAKLLQGISGEEKFLKLRIFLFFVGLCSPIGYLLIAERTEFLSTETDKENADFELVEKTDDHDLLDLSMDKENKTGVVRKNDHNSVLWWMLTFILSSIPFIGLGFSIYWSVAKTQVRRGNWAVSNIIVTMVTNLFLTYYYISNMYIPMESSRVGLFIIGIILFFGVLLTVSAVFNNRNQENLSLENYNYSPTVSGWLVYSLLMGIPLVNIICLIVYASESKEKYRQTWAQGRLLLIPFSLITLFYYSNMLEMFRSFSF